MSIIEELRAHREEQEQRGAGRILYPQEMMDRAVIFMTERRSQGVKEVKVAKEIGLSRSTVQRWLRVAAQSDGSPPSEAKSMRPVRLRVAPVMLRRMAAVVDASGVVRIEGGVHEMAELVRSLRR